MFNCLRKLRSLYTTLGKTLKPLELSRGHWFHYATQTTPPFKLHSEISRLRAYYKDNAWMCPLDKVQCKGCAVVAFPKRELRGSDNGELRAKGWRTPPRIVWNYGRPKVAMPRRTRRKYGRPKGTKVREEEEASPQEEEAPREHHHEEADYSNCQPVDEY